MKKETLFILYDSRAAGGDTNRAAVLSTANTLKEIRDDSDDLYPDQGAVIFKYDATGVSLVNEHFVE